jgi:hypothetical protein
VGTDGLHHYEPHVRDWRSGDPTWKEGKGKGLIGALHYLYDVSKLDQWQIVFDHAQRHGLRGLRARNHHKLAARGRPFLATFLFLGGSQHRVQIVSQLDPELALLRHQGDRFNQSTERLRGFCACVLALERRGEILRAPVVGVRSRP